MKRRAFLTALPMLMVELPEPAKADLLEYLRRNAWIIGQLEPKSAYVPNYLSSYNKLSNKVLNVYQAQALLETFRANFPQLAL